MTVALEYEKWLSDKGNNPFQELTHVRCIKLVPGRNIYPGDTGWVLAHNAVLVGFTRNTGPLAWCEARVPHDHFVRIEGISS